jgi:hypothetical protein
VSLEAAEEMLPDPPERKVGLAGVEGHALIAEQVEIQRLPGGRAFFDQKKPFEG